MSETPITNALLVEDNPGDARLAQEAFRECETGYFRVTHVETLGAAIDHLGGGNDCDVVLLDLSLPDAKGLSAVSRLRSVNPEVPVVILTGLNDEDVAIDALQEGAQDLKPFTISAGPCATPLSGKKSNGCLPHPWRRLKRPVVRNPNSLQP